MRRANGWRGWVAAALLAFALALAAAVAAPARAEFSANYDFLKAVRDADGAKAKTLIDAPGSSVVNGRDPSTGEGALHIVVKRRDIAWTGFLLANHANPDLRDRDGGTPLLAAARIGYIEGAQLLLQVGAQANLANNSGETPLIIAVQQRNAAMVRLLVSGGADPRVADHVAGQSAYDYAKSDPRAAAIVRMLDEARPRSPARSIGPSQ